MAVPYLIEGIQKNQELVRETLDGFISYGTKIRDERVLLILLKLPFEETHHLIVELLSTTKFPNLQQPLQAYLLKHQDKI